MRSAALAASAVAVLLLPAAAGAHGGGPTEYESTVTAVRPKVPGLVVTVRDGDDRVRLENRSGLTVVIEGYDGEPYLRFSRDGVSSNERSPALWLNDDRFGLVDVPPSADPEAPPAWRTLSRGRAWEWHDHRAHWMSPIPPPNVERAPDERHHVFDWRIPATVGEERVAIVGKLEYVPREGRSWPAIAAFAIGFGTVVGALLILLVGRRWTGSSE